MRSRRIDAASECILSGKVIGAKANLNFEPRICRESLAERMLGKNFTALKQTEYNQALETNLLKRAEQAAPGLKSDKFSELQKRAFDSFLRDAASRRARVIILVGQFNPLLGERINPGLRPE